MAKTLFKAFWKIVIILVALSTVILLVAPLI